VDDFVRVDAVGTPVVPSTHGFTRGTSSPNIHDQFVAFVETMLQLNKDYQRATLPEQKEQLIPNR